MELQTYALEDSVAAISGLPTASRARARWVTNLGREPIGVLYLLMVEMFSQDMDPTVVTALALNFFEHSDNGRLAELVDGNWLRTNYQIKEGPAIGRLLKLIEEAELKGDVTNVQEARKWLWDNQKTCSVRLPAPVHHWHC